MPYKDRKCPDCGDVVKVRARHTKAGRVSRIGRCAGCGHYVCANGHLVEFPTWNPAAKDGRGTEWVGLCTYPSCCAQRTADHPAGLAAGLVAEDELFARWMHGLRGKGLSTRKRKGSGLGLRRKPLPAQLGRGQLLSERESAQELTAAELRDFEEALANPHT